MQYGGGGNFRNELIWTYGKMSNTSRNFPTNHDTILRYTKTDQWTFHKIKGEESEYKTRYKKYVCDNKVTYGAVKWSKDKLIIGRIRKVKKELDRELEDSDILFDFNQEYKTQSDVIYCSIIKGNSEEHTGYPTQKPLALLERIVKASSNEGDIILDPFCGCATALVAAESLGRQWIGIDLSPKAVELIRCRLDILLGNLFRPNMVTERSDIPNRTDIGKLPPYKTHKHSLYGKQEGICAGCQIHFPFRNMTVDHIVPQSKGGNDYLGNLQLLCGACNSTKGTKDQATFLAELKKKGIRK